MKVSNLLEGERFDDLEIGGLELIQHADKYCFTSDSVLLSAFARVLPGETAADLGTGSGVVAILLSAKTRAKHIYGIEIQPYMADMAKRSVEHNDLGARISIINCRMQDSHKHIGHGSIDVVVSNPPYRKADTGAKQAEASKVIARHEVEVCLSEVVESAARLLRFGGRFYMVHQTERLADIIFAMKVAKLEPKRLRLIVDKQGGPAKRLLIEAHKNGKSGLVVERDLVIQDSDGNYTLELNEIYGRRSDGRD